MSSPKRKPAPLIGNMRRVSLQPKTIVASEPFRRGVADYHAGRWSEVEGRCAGVQACGLYEVGRLAAAFTGAREIGVTDFVAAIRGGSFPPPANLKGL